MDEHQHIDHLFQKATQKHSELPSAKVWVNLEKDLQKRNMTSLTKKYKKWKWAALLLFVFSIAIGTYCFLITWRYNNTVKKLELHVKHPGNKSNSSSISENTGHWDIQNNPGNLLTIKTKKQTPAIDKTDSNIATASGSIAESDTIKTIEKIYSDINKKERTTSGHNKNSIVYNNPLSEQRVSNSHLYKATAPQPGKIKNIQKGNTIEMRPGYIEHDALASTGLPSKNNMDSTSTSFLTAVLPIERTSDLKAASVGTSLNLLEINTDALMTWLSINGVNITKSVTGNGYKSHTRSIYQGNYTAAVYYSRDKVSNYLTANRPDFREDNYQQIKNHEKNRISNTTQLLLSRRIGRNWSVGSGIGHTVLITDIYAKPLVARRDNNGNINYRISTSSGYAYYAIKALPRPAAADSLRTLSSKSTVKYLSVPVSLAYHTKIRKFGLTPALFVSANFKTSGKIITVQSLEHTYSNNILGLKSGYYDGGMQLGLDYYLNKAMGITLAPYARFALSDATETRPVITRLNIVGVAAGINFHL